MPSSNARKSNKPMSNDPPEVLIGLTRADAERILGNFDENMELALNILMSRRDAKSVDQVEFMRRVMEALKKGLAE